MRRFLLLALLAPSALVFTCAGCSVTDTTSAASVSDIPETLVFVDDADPTLATQPFAADELLVQPFPGADAQALTSLLADLNLLVLSDTSDIGLLQLSVQGGDVDQVVTALSASGLIEEIHRNYEMEAEAIPDDLFFTNQQYLETIDAPSAWDETVGSEDIIIAIVDSGIDTTHADLEDKIIDGWNIFDNNDDFEDVAGHGTQAAGVAAAQSDNAIGIAGVAWDNPILAIRATNTRGRSTSRSLAAGILWAVANDAKVINVSFAPLWSNSVVRAAAEQAFNRGSLVVISAGNGGRSRKASGYPEALFVGALGNGDRIATFSDRGAFVDLVSPGTGIRTTEMGGEYGSVNGTSFAAPTVAGVAALAWSINPDLRPASIVNALTATAVDLGDRGKDDTYGFGLVDAFETVLLAVESADDPDRTSPTVRITKPRNGASLKGKTTIAVTATDDSAVADVVLSVDSIPIATDTRSPFRFVIDTTTFDGGDHTLSVVATDFAGNASSEARVDVRFSSASSSGGSAPSVSFRSPSEGTRVSGNVTISATVSADAGLSTVEWFVDGEAVVVNSVTGQSSGVSYLWRTADEESGSHEITVLITDLQGNQSSAKLELNVS